MAFRFCSPPFRPGLRSQPSRAMPPSCRETVFCSHRNLTPPVFLLAAQSSIDSKRYCEPWGSLLFGHPASWRRLSEIGVTGERQIADARTCGGENCVAESSHERWHSRLSHAGRRRAALDNVDVGLGRHLV